MISIRHILVASTVATLTACVGHIDNVNAPFESHGQGPSGAVSGSCWEKDVTPAVVETTTEQIVVESAQYTDDGTLLRPAIYSTVTRPRIVQERREIWFETPCPFQLTPAFVASLQRALAARGHYRGPINGLMTPWTMRAVRAFQKPQGLDSGILSRDAAQKLGLISHDSVSTPPPQTAEEVNGQIFYE